MCTCTNKTHSITQFMFLIDTFIIFYERFIFFNDFIIIFIIIFRPYFDYIKFLINEKKNLCIYYKMNRELCLVICFIVGVLAYHLLKSSCGCNNVVEGIKPCQNSAGKVVECSTNPGSAIVY